VVWLATNISAALRVSVPFTKLANETTCNCAIVFLLRANGDQDRSGDSAFVTPYLAAAAVGLFCDLHDLYRLTTKFRASSITPHIEDERGMQLKYFAWVLNRTRGKAEEPHGPAAF